MTGRRACRRAGRVAEPKPRNPKKVQPLSAPLLSDEERPQLRGKRARESSLKRHRSHHQQSQLDAEDVCVDRTMKREKRSRLSSGKGSLNRGSDVSHDSRVRDQDVSEEESEYRDEVGRCDGSSEDYSDCEQDIPGAPNPVGGEFSKVVPGKVLRDWNEQLDAREARDGDLDTAGGQDVFVDGRARSEGLKGRERSQLVGFPSFHQPCHQQPSKERHPAAESGQQICASARKSGLISEDVAAVQRIISKAVAEIHRRIDAQEERMAQGFSESRKRDDDIQNVVAPILVLLSSSQNQAPTSRTQKQVLLDSKVALLDKILTDRVLQVVLEQCLMGYIRNQVCPNPESAVQGSADRVPEDLQQIGAKCLNALLFSKLPSDKKSKYQTEEGVAHSQFRMGVLLTTLRCLQLDSMNIFAKSTTGMTGCNGGSATTGTGVTSDGTELVTPLRIPQPTWLKAGYITREHCESVKVMKESTAAPSRSTGLDNGKKRKVESISRDDLATHAAMRLYSLITNTMHRCREVVKVSFYEEIGYLFSSWSDLGVDIVQRNMKLWWASSEESHVSFEEVPKMAVEGIEERKATFLDDSDENAVNMHNNEKMTTFMAKHKNFILFAEHDVHIRVDIETRQRGRRAAAPELPTRRFRRAFNLLDVASRFLATYSSMGAPSTPTTFVSCHKDSLRCTFVIANILKEMISKVVNEFEEKGVTWSHGQMALCDVAMCGLVVSDLFPSRSKQKEALSSNILTVTDAEFNARHVGSEVDMSRATVVDTAPMGPDPIPLDDRANIFSIGDPLL